MNTPPPLPGATSPARWAVIVGDDWAAGVRIIGRESFRVHDLGPDDPALRPGMTITLDTAPPEVQVYRGMPAVLDELIAAAREWATQ